MLHTSRVHHVKLDCVTGGLVTKLQLLWWGCTKQISHKDPWRPFVVKVLNLLTASTVQVCHHVAWTCEHVLNVVMCISIISLQTQERVWWFMRVLHLTLKPTTIPWRLPTARLFTTWFVSYPQICWGALCQRLSDNVLWKTQSKPWGMQSIWVVLSHLSWPISTSSESWF